MARRYLLPGLLITILLVATIVATRSGAISLFSPEDLTPTTVPPELLTQVAQESTRQSLTATAYPPFATQFAQTEQALQLTQAAAPTLDLQEMYPIFSILPSADEILYGSPDYPLAGYGILYEGREAGDADHKYRFNGSVWQEETLAQ